MLFECFFVPLKTFPVFDQIFILFQELNAKKAEMPKQKESNKKTTGKLICDRPNS